MPRVFRLERVAALAATVALALVAPIAAASVAAAHTALVASSPAEGEVVAELDRVALEFTEVLLEIGHELEIEAPDGERTALKVDSPVTETISAAVPAGALEPGENLLVWRVVAADGHPIDGVVTFTYAPTSDPVDSPSPSPSSPAASPTPSATASAAPVPTPTSTSSSSAAPARDQATGASGPGVVPWILAGLAAVAAAAAALAWARRRAPSH